MATIRDLVAKIPVDQHQKALDDDAVLAAQQALADAQKKDTADAAQITTDMIAAAQEIHLAGGFAVDPSASPPILYISSADGQSFTSTPIVSIDQLIAATPKTP